MDPEIVTFLLGGIANLSIETKSSKLLEYLASDTFQTTLYKDEFTKQRDKLFSEVKKHLQHRLDEMELKWVQEQKDGKLIKETLSREGTRHVGDIATKIASVEDFIKRDKDTPFPGMFNIVDVMSKNLVGLPISDALASMNPQVATLFMDRYRQWNLSFIEFKANQAMLKSQLEKLQITRPKRRMHDDLLPLGKRNKIEEVEKELVKKLVKKDNPREDSPSFGSTRSVQNMFQHGKKFPIINLDLDPVEPFVHCEDANCAFNVGGPPVSKPNFVSLYNISIDLNYHPEKLNGCLEWCKQYQKTYQLIESHTSTLNKRIGGHKLNYYVPKERLSSFKTAFKDMIETGFVSNSSSSSSEEEKVGDFPKIDLSKNPCKPLRHCDNPDCGFVQRGPPPNKEKEGLISLYNISMEEDFHPIQTKTVKRMTGFGTWCTTVATKFGLVVARETTLMNPDYIPNAFYCRKEKLQEFKQAFKKDYITRLHGGQVESKNILRTKGYPDLDLSKNPVKPYRHCDDKECSFNRRGPPIEMKNHVSIYNICIDLNIHPGKNRNDNSVLSSWLNKHSEEFDLKKNLDVTLVNPRLVFKGKTPSINWYCPKDEVEALKKSMIEEYKARFDSDEEESVSGESEESSEESGSEESSSEESSSESGSESTSQSNSVSKSKSSKKSTKSKQFSNPKILQTKGYPDIDLSKNPVKPLRHCDNPECGFSKRGPPVDKKGWISIYNICIDLNFHPIQTDNVKQISGLGLFLSNRIQEFNLKSCEKQTILNPSKRAPIHYYVGPENVDALKKSLKGYMKTQESRWGRVTQGSDGEMIRASSGTDKTPEKVREKTPLKNKGKEGEDVIMKDVVMERESSEEPLILKLPTFQRKTVISSTTTAKFDLQYRQGHERKQVDGKDDDGHLIILDSILDSPVKANVELKEPLQEPLQSHDKPIDKQPINQSMEQQVEKQGFKIQPRMEFGKPVTTLSTSSFFRLPKSNIGVIINKNHENDGAKQS